MSVQVSIPPSVVFTESAARRVYDLMLEDGNPDLKLRVYIEGGGCSGFQYGFTFADCANDEDMVVAREIEIIKKEIKDEEDDEGGEGSGTATVDLLIDPLSFQYLVGSEIDYVDDLEGERFVIRNPNAQTTCGCGSSFSV